MRFAIIDTWPEVSNAETEVIARLKIAAKNIGAECFIVNMDGYLISDPGKHVVDCAVDFCLALHFLNTKIHQVFTYHAVWNPPQFLEDWDGIAMGCHVLSCDDFLGYSADYMLAHYNNMIACLHKTIDTSLQFVPSVPESSMLLPVLKNKQIKLFYSGINWERGGKRKGRHHDLLLALDQADTTEIYGPERFFGARPWEGFSSYRGSLPFDGISAIQAIHRCGVCLVLSSDVHRVSGAVSSRLYEGCAAGAVIIADNNPFIEKIMGDSVLYFTYEKDQVASARKIRDHYHWIIEHPEKAEVLARRSQAIIREHFTFEKLLKDVFSAHPSRQEKLSRLLSNPGKDQAIDLILYTEDMSKADLNKIFDQINQQAYEKLHIIVVSSSTTLIEYSFRFGITTTLVQAESQHLIGASFRTVIQAMQGEFFAFVTQGCRLDVPHFASLRKCLDHSETHGAAYSAYFVETPQAELFFHSPQRRHLYFSPLKMADILNLNYDSVHFPRGRVPIHGNKLSEDFCYKIPCEAFLFKKSVLSSLENFPFECLDDRNNHRYKIWLFQIAILMQGGSLEFSKIASLLVLDNAEDRPRRAELVSDEIQHALIQKKYLFDNQFQDLQQRYPDLSLMIKKNPLSRGERVKKHLCRFYPRVFKFLLWGNRMKKGLLRMCYIDRFKRKG